MTHQEQENVMEAVTEAVLEDGMLRHELTTQELLFAANMIRRKVARKLNVTASTPPLSAA